MVQVRDDITGDDIFEHVYKNSLVDNHKIMLSPRALGTITHIAEKGSYAVDHPYLPFMLFSPFRGAMTSRLSTPPEQISLDEDAFRFQLPQDVSKSWKTLEQSCLQTITVLRDFFKTQHPTVFLVCSDPPKPSEFGYSKCYRTKEKARLALALPYLPPLTLSCFFLPMLPFVGVLTISPVYLQVRRHRRSQVVSLTKQDSSRISKLTTLEGLHINR